MLRTLARAMNPFDRTAGFVVPHLIVGALILTGAFLAGAFASSHFVPHGGYNPKHEHLPPPVRIEGGIPPASYSLDSRVIRLHNQGSTNSCVGQSVAEIIEIQNAERGHRQAVSSGWIWNRLNGGYNQGITYSAAFDLLQSSGDPYLSQYGNDGTYVAYAPPLDAPASNHISSWITIAPGDRLSIEREVSSGRPVAIAMPWSSSLVDKADGSMVYSQGGYFEFWHSTVIVAYNAYGVEILNSWPWGQNQRAWFSWSFIAAAWPDGTGGYSTATIVGARPTLPLVQKKAHFPLWLWNQYRKEHKLHLIHARNHKHHLYESSWLWWKHHPKSVKHLRDIGGVVSATFTKQPHRRGYERVRFQRFDLYYWPHQRSYRPRWHKHEWVK